MKNSPNLLLFSHSERQLSHNSFDLNYVLLCSNTFEYIPSEYCVIVNSKNCRFQFYEYMQYTKCYDISIIKMFENFSYLTLKDLPQYKYQECGAGEKWLSFYNSSSSYKGPHLVTSTHRQQLYCLFHRIRHHLPASKTLYAGGVYSYMQTKHWYTYLF